MSPEDRVTFFNADGNVLASFGHGQGTTSYAASVAIDDPWSRMLVEVPAESPMPYAHASESSGC